MPTRNSWQMKFNQVIQWLETENEEPESLESIRGKEYLDFRVKQAEMLCLWFPGLPPILLKGGAQRRRQLGIGDY